MGKGILTTDGPFDGLRAGTFDKLRAGTFDGLRAGTFDRLRAGTDQKGSGKRGTSFFGLSGGAAPGQIERT
jgi:hypothetical protein